MRLKRLLLCSGEERLLCCRCLTSAESTRFTLERWLLDGAHQLSRTLLGHNFENEQDMRLLRQSSPVVLWNLRHGCT